MNPVSATLDTLGKIIVIVYIMPPFGFGLLDMAGEVAAFDLPARIGRLFGG